MVPGSQFFYTPLESSTKCMRVVFAINSESTRRMRRNFARRPVSYLCNSWAGSDVDRGSSLGRKCIEVAP